jgi:hypothetical protein
LALTATPSPVDGFGLAVASGPSPHPYPWSVNRASAAQILSDARRARTDGTKVVIVNLHWGDENVAQPSNFQLALAGTLTRSPDITAIVGQHVHIVQPIRILKPVVFGEGNLISNQTSACCPAASQDGMIVLLTITVDSRGAHVSSSTTCRSGSGIPITWCSRPAPRGAPIPPTPRPARII